jgi:hypothetical protein
MREKRNAYKISIRISEDKTLLAIHTHEDNIKMDLKEMLRDCGLD